MKPFEKNLNRRDFLTMAGGGCAILGAAAFARHGASEGATPVPGSALNVTEKKDPGEGCIHQVTTDVLIVGGGMAGVFAAVNAHDNGARVVLVDKGAVGRSGQTPFARGIFRYDEEATGMSKADYLTRMAEVSEYINIPAYTKLLLDESANRIKDLDTWGFFDEACYAPSLTRPLKQRKIPIYERVTLTHLMKEQGRIAGAAGLFIDKKETLVVRAKSVVLCTGASGFKPAGWQIGSLTSDGDAMAYRIGAEITGKEWNDGHSRTNYGLDGLNRIESTPDLHGMLGVEENVEVSRNGPMSHMGPPPGGRPGGPPGEGLDGGPGNIPEGSGNHAGPPPHGEGMPPGGSMQMIGGASAGMSIHKAEGLFPADARCASNIPGLYAAGDALGSMQSGGIYAQRGSSLVGSAAQGALAGKAAAEWVKDKSPLAVSDRTLQSINTEIYAPYLRERGFSPQWVTQTLQGVMIPNFILYVKSDERLRAALSYVEYLRDHQVPLLVANDLHELRQAHETANMVLNAEMKLRASLMRTETRGSHYREDFPDRNDEEWLAWIKIRLAANGQMELVKHSIHDAPSA